jgi:hypothetical protein
VLPRAADDGKVRLRVGRAVHAEEADGVGEPALLEHGRDRHRMADAHLGAGRARPTAADPSAGASVSSSSTTVIVPKGSFCSVVPCGRIPPAKTGMPLPGLTALVAPPRPVRKGMLLLSTAPVVPEFTFMPPLSGRTAPLVGRAKGRCPITTVLSTVPATMRTDGFVPPRMSCMKNTMWCSPLAGFGPAAPAASGMAPAAPPNAPAPAAAPPAAPAATGRACSR